MQINIHGGDDNEDTITMIVVMMLMVMTIYWWWCRYNCFVNRIKLCLIQSIVMIVKISRITITAIITISGYRSDLQCVKAFTRVFNRCYIYI